MGLPDTNQDCCEDRLADLLLAWEEKWEQGQEVSAEALCADEPALLEPLRRSIEALKAFADSPSEDVPIGPGQPEKVQAVSRFSSLRFHAHGGLGVLFEAYEPDLGRWVAIKFIRAEYARLRDRIRSWPTVPKTPEMLDEERAMLASRSKSRNTREKFAAGVDFAIAMQKHHLNLGDVVEGVLALSELTRDQSSFLIGA